MHQNSEFRILVRHQVRVFNSMYYSVLILTRHKNLTQAPEFLVHWRRRKKKTVIG